MDCCSSEGKFDYDIVFIGSGSAAFAGAIKASELGKKVAIVEKSTLGGTCVNVGCVPSKNLIRAAETKHHIENSNFASIPSQKTSVDFGKLITDKDELVANLRQAKYQSVLDMNESVNLINGEAKFIDKNTIEVSGNRITFDKAVISTGSSPFVPPIPGLKEASYLTSTTAFELKEQPKSLAVLGGGYIALELAQMFHRLGTKVTIVQRSEVLFQEDNDVSDWISTYLKSEGVEILNRTTISNVSNKNGVKTLLLESHGEERELVVDDIVVATGRSPNTLNLNIEEIGVKLNENKTVKVNEYCQTTVENIYAAGDVTSSPALVYVAAYEGNLATENAFSGNTRKADYSSIPWVIFSDPQVVGVGLNETQAKAENIETDVSILSFDNVPRAIAAQDTRGFIKLIRRTGTDELIGARIVAPEASELIMELTLAIKYKIPITELGSQMHPYLTQSEAVKLAAQTFDKDVKSLSCCAS